MSKMVHKPLSLPTTLVHIFLDALDVHSGLRISDKKAAIAIVLIGVLKKPII